MVMLSELCRFEITDTKDEHARLNDLAAPLLESDYPQVSHLFYETNKKFMQLPWSAVQSIDYRARRIEVTDLSVAEETPRGGMKDKVLLRYEILDALILDLQNRRATRANDLELEEENGDLFLRAADTSASGILRRISRGLYHRVDKKALYDWKYVEFLRGDPQAVRSGAGYHMRINRMSPGEIAQLTNFLPYLHAAELLTLLPDPKAVDTLEAMASERQLQVFEELAEEEAVRFLTLMAPDIAADLLGRLQTAMMKKYLESLNKKQSERIIELLRYPEDTVGGIMTNDVVSVRADLTVAEARELLRERLKEPDFVHLIYAVADEETRELRGVFSLRDLLTAGDEQNLEAIMNPFVATLNALEPATESSFRVVDSQLAGMPVIGQNKKLIGVVTVDAAITQIMPPSKSEQIPRIFS